MSELVVAVDVGTGSARAGVLDRGGRLLGRAEHPIWMNRPHPSTPSRARPTCLGSVEDLEHAFRRGTSRQGGAHAGVICQRSTCVAPPSYGREDIRRCRNAAITRSTLDAFWSEGSRA